MHSEPVWSALYTDFCTAPSARDGWLVAEVGGNSVYCHDTAWLARAVYIQNGHRLKRPQSDTKTAKFTKQMKS